MNGEVIRLSKASISNLEIASVNSVLKEEYLGMGRYVELFERKLQEYIATDYHVVCVNSGTAALHTALVALGIGVGDEVIVPSITYVASFQAISATGATPIPCDVNKDTCFMCPLSLEKLINENTKCVMPVHHASSPKGITKIYDIAKKNNLRVIEDAAQAFGSKLNNQMVGSFGDIICLSFDGIKNITCGEGGAILSSDINLIEKCKDIRLLGVSKDTEKRLKGERSWDFDVDIQGFRYHMSNINAAIGIVQLERFNDFAEKRKELVSVYKDKLEGIKELTFFDLDYENIVPHIFCLKAENRDGLREYLLRFNIETGIHYKPNHYLKKYNSITSYLINTDFLYNSIITLPLHYDLTYAEQLEVVKRVKEFYEY